MRDGCIIWKNLPTTLQNIIYYLLQKADPPIPFSKNKIDYISWKLDEMSTLIEVNGLIYGTVCGDLDWNEYETDVYEWTTSPETYSGKSDPDPVAYIVASILEEYSDKQDVEKILSELPEDEHFQDILSKDADFKRFLMETLPIWLKGREIYDEDNKIKRKITGVEVKDLHYYMSEGVVIIPHLYDVLVETEDGKQCAICSNDDYFEVNTKYIEISLKVHIHGTIGMCWDT